MKSFREDYQKQSIEDSIDDVRRADKDERRIVRNIDLSK
jgi:hypothetical protein